MFYIIQENLFREYNYDNLIKTMKRFDFDYEVVKFNAKTKTIDFNTDRTDIFCFGAVMMSKVARKYKWKPGSMLNDFHDFDSYAPKFGYENMLNGEGTVQKFSDPIPYTTDKIFIRPIKDSKTFTGKVYTHDEWCYFVTTYDRTDKIVALSPDDKILVSPVKDIYQEVRCWVVGGEVITTSRYKIGNRVLYTNFDHESYYVDFAQKMADKYQPAEAFVIDICSTIEGLKIVEVNNINSAGFYDCNLGKLIQSIEDYFGHEE